MARDMHKIRLMLEEAQSRIAMGQYRASRDSLTALLNFFNRDAELDGPALEIAAEDASEAEQLLLQIIPKCKLES